MGPSEAVSMSNLAFREGRLRTGHERSRTCTCYLDRSIFREYFHPGCQNGMPVSTIALDIPGTLEAGPEQRLFPVNLGQTQKLSLEIWHQKLPEE